MAACVSLVCSSVLVFYVCMLVQLSLCFVVFFFLMIRRPPRSTLDRSSAASDVYKRQFILLLNPDARLLPLALSRLAKSLKERPSAGAIGPVSYTHLRAHETVLDLVCRLLLEKKKPYNPTHIRRHAPTLT